MCERSIVWALVITTILSARVESGTTEIIFSPNTFGKCLQNGIDFSLKAASIQSYASTNMSCEIRLTAASQRAEGFIVNMVSMPVDSDQFVIYDYQYNRNITIDRFTKAACHLLSPRLLIMYKSSSHLGQASNMKIIFSQYMCQTNSLCYVGCKTSECIRSNSQFPCHKACISSAMRCDGVSNCPFQEDEISCVISTLSRVAFIGTVTLFVVFMIAGIVFIALKKFRRPRNRSNQAFLVDMQNSMHPETVGQSPPSYTELEAVPSYYVPQNEELPKYQQLETMPRQRENRSTNAVASQNESNTSVEL